MKKPAQASPVAGDSIASVGPAQSVRLSDPAMAESVSELKNRLRNDPGFARRMLREAGILNRDGRLTKAFGG
ncbi:MAG: hypothetical protein J0L58_12705 [Burkholderiales bacterium]|nr:hypothetical protein [Burkholderiales bacterium]